jgi:L-ascorbate metabolism protein UlaG (beta-lactamase superfamily)
MTMRIDWHGQSAFLVEADGRRVFIDPFGEMGPLEERGIRWEYPPITGVSADLVLITHEHLDHNAAEVIDGSPAVIRATAGKLESPVGEVTAVASEHDRSAGTERGPNSIMTFTLGGQRVCHFGDFGQAELRGAQAEAIGTVDLLFVPVGAGPTIGAAGAAAVVERLAPSWVVPMHYRTEKIGFLEPVDEFAASFGDERIHRAGDSSVELADVPAAESGPVLVLLDPPG